MDLEERLRAALAAHDKQTLKLGEEAHLRTAAAVLIPVFEREGEPGVVLTRRTDTVRRHKGEISFPGGVQDRGDADLLSTALREAQEEIGLDPEAVRVVGELDDIPTFVTGYLVSPFVGIVPQSYPWRPRAEEVAEVLELPVRELARVERLEEWVRGGVTIPMYVYEIGEARIWGATARILWQFLSVVRPALGL